MASCENRNRIGSDLVLKIEPAEFSDGDKEVFLDVVSRDERFRLDERSRLRRLVNEWRGVLARGISDEDEAIFVHHCKRCCASLGRFINTGALCPFCRKKVCKQCRVFISKTSRRSGPKWVCVVCAKSRQLCASSGAWYYSRKQTIAYGSMLLKMAFSIATKKDSAVFKDPVWTDIFAEEEEVDDVDDVPCTNLNFDSVEEVEEIDESNPADLTVDNAQLSSVVSKKESVLLKDMAIEGMLSLKKNQELGEEPVEAIDNVEDGNDKVEEIVDVSMTTEPLPVAQVNEVMDEESANPNEELRRSDSIENSLSTESTMLPRLGARGQVQVSFFYKERESVFEICIYKAVDLLNADSNHSSANPYAKVYLSSSSRSLGKKKTKVHKNTLNPNFDETISYSIDYEELLTCTCTIGIWHQEFANKNISVGEADIDISEFLDSDNLLKLPSRKWYTIYRGSKLRTSSVLSLTSLYSRASSGSMLSLHSRSGGKALGTQVVNVSTTAEPLPVIKVNEVTEQESFITNEDIRRSGSIENTLSTDSTKLPRLGARGQVQVSFLYNESESLFEICIYKAIDLLNADSNHSSANPYAKVYLSSSSRSLGKKKTRVHRNTLNPDFDETISYSIVYKELLTCTCTIGIWHQEFANKNISVGEADIDINEFLESGNSLELPSRKWYTIYRGSKLRTSSVLSIPSMYSRASSGSVLSLYSSAGGKTLRTQITGEILLAIKHTGVELVVYIDRAKGIAAVDKKNGISNPYCKVYLYPDETRATKKKTYHRRKTINPQWNETIKYEIPRSELLQKILQVSIWNHDRFGRNDFLGEVQINITDYSIHNNLQHNIPMWYTLQEMAPISAGASTESRGELRLLLVYDQNVLHVHIIEASGLYNIDPQKDLSPFAECYLLPDKSRKGQRKTTVKKKTQAPKWEESFEFQDIGFNELYSRVLEVTVWDHNKPSHHFLGGLRLGVASGDELWHDSSGEEVAVWEKMMNQPGTLAEAEILLRPTMTSKHVQIAQKLPDELSPSNGPRVTFEYPL